MNALLSRLTEISFAYLQNVHNSSFPVRVVREFNLCFSYRLFYRSSVVVVRLNWPDKRSRHGKLCFECNNLISSLVNKKYAHYIRRTIKRKQRYALSQLNIKRINKLQGINKCIYVRGQCPFNS